MWIARYFILFLAKITNPAIVAIDNSMRPAERVYLFDFSEGADRMGTVTHASTVDSSVQLSFFMSASIIFRAIGWYLGDIYVEFWSISS